MSINFDDLESRPGFFVTSKPEQVTFLPEPERRPRRFTLISVDDHLVEPPHLFEGRMPARFADLAPRVELDDDGHGVLALRRAAALQGRPQRGRRPADRGAQLRAEPLRRDAARRVGHRRPRARHGPQRRLRVAQLPVVARRVRRAALPARRERSRARAGRRAGVERLAPRGVGRHPSRVGSSRARCRGCSTPSWPPTRSAATPRGASVPSRSPSCPSDSGCRRCTPASGIRSWPPARRPGTVVCLHVGSSSTAPITSSDAPADTIGVLFFGWAMFAAVDWLYSKIPVRFPDLQDLPVRGRARLGGRPARPARPRRPLPADVRHLGGHRPHAPRGDAAQLLVLRDRRPVRRSSSATASASTTCCSRPTTRTRTARGPTPRSCCTTRSGTSRPTTSASSPGRTPPNLFEHPVPDAVQRRSRRVLTDRPIDRAQPWTSPTSGSASPPPGASSTGRAATATSAAT